MLPQLPIFALLALLLSACTLSPQGTTQPTPNPGVMPRSTFHKGVNLSHYLSQVGSKGYARSGYITEADLAWIAGRGYDHIRLPVDGPLLLDGEGRIIEKRLPALDRVIGWAHGQGLGVLLDIHKLPGSTFSGDIDSRLFTSEKLQRQAIDLWRVLAERYKEMGPELRFEILNEPVADKDELVTAFYAKVLAAIREYSPERKVYLCSNRWGKIETLPALAPLLDDPNVLVDIHYYDPHLFTHQKAAWVGSDIPGIPDIPFPGIVPDLKPWLPKGHYARSSSGMELTVDSIREDLARLKAWSERTGVEVYIGEFGVYKKAPPADSERWYRALMEEIDRQGFDWAVWDYKGAFAVRDEESGQPTRVQEVLDAYLD